MKTKILVVDDEQDILDILSFNLTKEGFQVYTANNGRDAIEIAREEKPDMIVLDIMMPEKNGIQTCMEIRSIKELKEKAIVFLTAMSDENSEIQGLEIGADDYITKPIKPKLLISKIKSILRRFDPTKDLIDANGLIINRETFTVNVGEEEVILPRKEFELLALLASKPGKVFLRQEILDKVWGTEVIVGDRTIDVHVRKIRKKLRGDYIQTVKGVGYKFIVG